MDYFLEFHWWYIGAGLALFLFLGKGKGGFVEKRFTADLEVLDPRFGACRTQATYAIFKEGTPDHIEIEVEDLFLAVGEYLEIYLDDTLLSKIKVKKDKEAEFDHWSDEKISFPRISGGEHIVIKYQNSAVFAGVFE